VKLLSSDVAPKSFSHHALSLCLLSLCLIVCGSIHMGAHNNQIAFALCLLIWYTSSFLFFKMLIIKIYKILGDRVTERM